MKVCFIKIYEAEGKDFQEASDRLNEYRTNGIIEELLVDEVWARAESDEIAELIENRNE